MGEEMIASIAKVSTRCVFPSTMPLRALHPRGEPGRRQRWRLSDRGEAGDKEGQWIRGIYIYISQSAIFTYFVTIWIEELNLQYMSNLSIILILTPRYLRKSSLAHEFFTRPWDALTWWANPRLLTTNSLYHLFSFICCVAFITPLLAK